MTKYPAIRLLLGLILIASAHQSHAQKKVVPVAQSALSGMRLPSGSKQDSRLLTEMAAKTLFEMETQKAGTAVTKVEVLLLPVSSGFTTDSLAANLARLGYSMQTLETDKKYAWLQKDLRHLIVYAEKKKTELNVYFGELKTAPGKTGTANAGSGKTQLPADPANQAEGKKQQTIQESNTQQSQGQQQTTTNNNSQTFSSKGFAFTTTNFDDGWNSTVQEDWVQVTRGNISVLLHYPKEGTIIPADPEPLTNNAWNILVAPRYSNLTNYRTAYINTYDRPYLGMGTATENATGRSVFVVLFRQGQSGWIEFIAPDKNAFIQQFRFDPETIQWNSESDLMNNLSVMKNYNKFAVALSDFNGVWTSDFTGMQQLYHVYTGNYAGMHINQSRETFEFAGNGSYHWKLLVVNGMVGSMNTAQVQSNGALTLLNNWQIHCTDIEGKPKKYHAFFSCIKGARLLHLLDADYPGNGMYTIFGRK